MGLAANCYSLLHLLRERLLQKNQNRMILLLIHLTIADLCVILVITFLLILIIIIILIILAILLIIHLTIADLCVILVTKISMVPLLHKARTRFNLLFLAIQLFGSPPTIVAIEANSKDLSL